MIKQITAIILMANVTNSANLVTVFLDNQTANHQYVNNYNSNYNLYDYYYKSTNNTPLNNYMDIHTNNYSANYGAILGNTTTANLENLYIMQIRPFYNIRQSELNIKEQIWVDFKPNFPDTIAFEYYAFWTKDNLAQYIDLTDYTSNSMWEIYANAQEQCTEYTQVWDDELTEITQTNHPYENIEINNIPIDDTETVYVLTYTNIAPFKVTNLLTESRDGLYMYVSQATFSGRMVNYTNGPEVVDIPGLMFTILSMPFAFISQAFNLTLFAGTAYQFNVGQFFLGLIGIAILLWVLKIIMGKTDLSSLMQDAHATKLENTKFKHAKQLEKQKNDNKVAREQQRHENATKEKSK